MNNSLKLVSNSPDNYLEGVGGAKLFDQTIEIEALGMTRVTLLRDINKVTLVEAGGQRQNVKGKVMIGDIYTLENISQDVEKEKLIIRVVEDSKEETSNLQELPKQNIFVNSDPIYDATSQKRKTTLTAGVLILVVLILSVIFGINQKNRRDFSENSEKILTEASLNYEKAIEESSLDKNSSRELFVSARNATLKLKNEGYKSEKLDKLLTDISGKESEIMGEKKAEVKEYLDLTLQTSGFNGKNIASTGEEMFIFDSEHNNIIQVDLSTKKAKIVAGKDKLERVGQIASYEDKLFSMADDGIYQINNEKTKVKDKDWGESLFYLYSANIYLVDKTANQIFRLSGSTLGKNISFSDKSEWLAPGIEADFSKIKDMAIDGSIWLLSSTGKIIKFTNGNPNNISMSGMVDILTNPSAIYTNEDLKYTYVLDSEKGRVIVLEKNGAFRMQYSSDDIKQAKDLVVSEKEGKAILLTGPKLTYFEL